MPNPSLTKPWALGSPKLRVVCRDHKICWISKVPFSWTPTSNKCNQIICVFCFGALFPLAESQTLRGKKSGPLDLVPKNKKRCNAPDCVPALGGVSGTAPLHKLGSTSQQEPSNTNVLSALVPRTLLKRAQSPQKNLKNCHFSTLLHIFEPGAGNPFADFFQGFLGRGFLSPVEGQRCPNFWGQTSMIKRRAQPRPRPFFEFISHGPIFIFGVPPDAAPNAPSTQWNTEKAQRFFI